MHLSYAHTDIGGSGGGGDGRRAPERERESQGGGRDYGRYTTRVRKIRQSELHGKDAGWESNPGPLVF